MDSTERSRLLVQVATQWDDMHDLLTSGEKGVDGDLADAALHLMVAGVTARNVSPGEAALLLTDAREAAAQVQAYQQGREVEPATEVEVQWHESRTGQRQAFEAWWDRLHCCVHALVFGVRVDAAAPRVPLRSVS